MLLILVILFTLFVPLMATIAIPYLLVWRFPIWRVDLGALHWLGLIPLALAGADYAWRSTDYYGSRGTPMPTQPQQELVARGLYRYTRNPMHVGVIVAITGMAILLGSGLLLAYLIVVFMLFHAFVILYEEPHLRQAFGAAYEDTCRRVPRWIALPKGEGPSQ